MAGLIPILWSTGTGSEVMQRIAVPDDRVKKVDPATAKVTLDHERILNIDMDAMTMAYKVQTPALLNGLKPGDKIRFYAEEVNGQTFITRIQPAR